MATKKNNVEKPRRGKIVLRPVQTDAKFIDEEGVMYEQKEFFSFKSRIAGTIFYPGDDGNTKQIEGGSVREDVSAREKEYLVNSDAYREGLVVEINAPETEIATTPVNAMNDSQLNHICQEYLDTKDKSKVVHYIEQMSSSVALENLKSVMNAKGLPGFIVKLVDSRIEELAELYEQSMQAPIAELK